MFRKTISSCLFHVRAKGCASLAFAICRKAYESIIPPRVKNHPMYLKYVQDKTGLEIGGPSPIFSLKGLVPIYPHVRNLDNCNFSDKTIWEGQITESDFKYGRIILGKQYIRDAIDLYGIKDDQYDFVISSEMLQHSANTIRALREWMRVTKDDGVLILILPHMKMTFDHCREITTLQHIINDFVKGVDESDLTHLDEILERHDLSRDGPAGDFKQFRVRSEQNIKFRALHQHVFDERLVVEVVNYVGLQIIGFELVMPHHIVVFAQKKKSSHSIDNSKYFSKEYAQFHAPNIFRARMTWSEK